MGVFVDGALTWNRELVGVTSVRSSSDRRIDSTRRRRTIGSMACDETCGAQPVWQSFSYPCLIVAGAVVWLPCPSRWCCCRSRCQHHAKWPCFCCRHGHASDRTSW